MTAGHLARPLLNSEHKQSFHAEASPPQYHSYTQMDEDFLPPTIPGTNSQ